MSRIKTFIYDWEMFDTDIRSILTQVDFTCYHKVIGIATGGLPLLTKLVNGIPSISYEIIKCCSYETNVRGKLSITRIEDLNCKDKAILLVDDVADTGFTLDPITDILKDKGAKSVETLTLCYKPQSIVVPTWYIHEVPNDCWIIFPWER